MAKIVLSDLNSTSSTSVLNSNFSKIQDALNNEVLYRDNPISEPNQMESLLDMNSNDIINVNVLTAKRISAESIENGGESIIAGGVADNELVKWDSTIAKFVGTGVYSTEDGDISTASNSVNIGVHDLGSAGRNVMFTNRIDNRHFSPVLQEVSLDDARTTNAMNRTHTGVEDYVFGSDSSTVITDPSWSFSSVGDQTVLSITLWPAVDMDSVTYEILEQGEVIFREYLVGHTANDNSKVFELNTPYDLYQGTQYTARLYTIDGKPCQFRGGVDGKPWYKVQLRPFTQKELATKEYVDNLPGSITVEDESGQLTVSDVTNLKFKNANIVDLGSGVAEIDSHIDIINDNTVLGSADTLVLKDGLKASAISSQERFIELDVDNTDGVLYSKGPQLALNYDNPVTFSDGETRLVPDGTIVHDDRIAVNSTVKTYTLPVGLYRIGAHLSSESKPDGQIGFASLGVYRQVDGSPLQDVGMNDAVSRIDLADGEKVGRIDLDVVVNITAQTEVYISLRHNLSTNGIVIEPDISNRISITNISGSPYDKVGLTNLFELVVDGGLGFAEGLTVNGNFLMNPNESGVPDQPQTVEEAAVKRVSNNWYLHSVAGNTIYKHTDDGLNMETQNLTFGQGFFSLEQFIPYSLTKNLRGKNITLAVQAADISNTLVARVVFWSGEPDKYNTDIVTIPNSEASSNPEVSDKWDIGLGLTLTGSSPTSNSIRVPMNATNIAVMINPEQNADDNKATITEVKLEGGSKFTGFNTSNSSVKNDTFNMRAWFAASQPVDKQLAVLSSSPTVGVSWTDYEILDYPQDKNDFVQYNDTPTEKSFTLINKGTYQFDVDIHVNRDGGGGGIQEYAVLWQTQEPLGSWTTYTPSVRPCDLHNKDEDLWLHHTFILKTEKPQTRVRMAQIVGELSGNIGIVAYQANPVLGTPESYGAILHLSKLS